MSSPARADIFVIMPFKEDFDDVNFVVKDAVRLVSAELGREFACIRADDIHSPGKITEQLIEAIRSATIVIADLSGTNPNVMYELGYAHGLGKDVIILNQNANEAPFDVKDFRQIIYDRTKLLRDCRQRVVTSILDVLKHHPSPGRDDSGSVAEKGGSVHVDRVLEPIRPSSELVARIQEIDIRLNYFRSHRDTKKLRDAYGELVEIIDRIAVLPSAQNAHGENTAAGIGNCAVELEKAKLADCAESIYRRGLSLFPRYPGLRFQYADFLLDEGRLEEAAQELAEGRALDPLHKRRATVEAKLLAKEKRADPEAEIRLRGDFENCKSEESAVAYLLYLSECGGKLEEFERVCTIWREHLPEHRKNVPLRVLADFLANSEEQDYNKKALDLYARLAGDGTSDEFVAITHNMATLYNRLGDTEKALGLWRVAYSKDPNNNAIRTSFSQMLSRNDAIEDAMKVINGETLDES